MNKIALGDDVKIAGQKTVGEWKTLKKDKLEANANDDAWKEAFDEFFIARLYTRYLRPIKLIQRFADDKTIDEYSEVEKLYLGCKNTLGEKQGEGFAMMTIACSLIEFLHTTRKGFNFDISVNKNDWKVKENQIKNGVIPADYYYGLGCSGDFYKEFLIQNEPFKNPTNFGTDENGVAKDFYEKIRCGLLHEAKTGGEWKIHANGSSIIDKNKSIIYRNNFVNALEEYVISYRDEIVGGTDVSLRDAFIRKFDGLCEYKS